VFNALSKKSLEIFQVKDYRNFVLGRLFLTLAIQMQMTTIILQVYYEYGLTKLGQGEEYKVIGLINLCEAIPFIISCFYSGYAADRFNRRKIILIANTVLLLGSMLLYCFCLPQFAFLKQYSYYPLLAIVVLFGVVRAFMGAAMAPFMSQLVPRSLFTQAATWNSTF
jgi:MFS family permease